MAGGAVAAENFSRPQDVYSQDGIAHTTFPNGGIVNKGILENLALVQPEEGYIVELTDGVWALVGYHWGYTALIEGETSLILYDTGDDLAEGLEIIELAKQVSDKPIRTIIYSHAHYVWGAQAIADAVGGDITIIGNPQLNQNILESEGLGAAIPELSPVLMARMYEQFSVLLPESGDDARAPTPFAEAKGFLPVTQTVEHGESLTIDGVEMIFYTDYESDSPDQIIVHLPKKDTVLNNFLWPAFPNFYTLRGSDYRDPTSWAGGVKLIRDLNPEYLVNTHTYPTIGKENIHNILTAYFDGIMYLYDQTLRGILLGKTPDELKYWLQFPNDLAETPNNQHSYGEFAYFPPHIYYYALGWFDRIAEKLNPISPTDQANKIVTGFGGVDTVKAELRKTLENNEFAWAAELGGYLVKAVPDDREAAGLLAAALRPMGYNTEASIPRSWYLTRALALEGELVVPTVVMGNSSSVTGSAPDTYVNQYRVRLDPKVSYGKNLMLAITLTGTEAPTMGLHVRSTVAEFVPDVSAYSRKADMSIDMTLDVWGGYFVGDITLDELLAHADVKVSDKDQVKVFFSLFDQVHPSKMALIPASAMQD
ncbi:MAG: alkyl sulfatase dimerization domain-containing protein [Paracoccaceae bacterium]